MIKKLVAISSLFILAGCQNFGSSQILYKISDEDTKKWVIEMNKLEQCLFPQEYKAQNFRSLSTEEHMLLNNAKFNLLRQIILPGYVYTIKTDSLSNTYAIYQFQRFKHYKKASFDTQWCQTQKKIIISL